MGRAVGGASAVGCGVFGLAGLLVGVVLVVWLGSTALDGSSGILGGGSDGTAPDRQLAGTEATIAVDPAAGLADGGRVEVTGADLPAGNVLLQVCLTHPGAADGCDGTTTTAAAVGTAGGFTATRTVPRVISVDGTRYDCAAARGSCSIEARLTDQPDEAGIRAPLTFAEGLPPVEAAAPPTS